MRLSQTTQCLMPASKQKKQSPSFFPAARWRIPPLRNVIFSTASTRHARCPKCLVQLSNWVSLGIGAWHWGARIERVRIGCVRIGYVRIGRVRIGRVRNMVRACICGSLNLYLQGVPPKPLGTESLAVPESLYKEPFCRPSFFFFHYPVFNEIHLSFGTLGIGLCRLCSFWLQVRQYGQHRF